MARTGINLDEEACRAVMERYGLPTKRDAVNFALRTVASEALDVVIGDLAPLMPTAGAHRWMLAAA